VVKRAIARGTRVNLESERGAKGEEKGKVFKTTEEYSPRKRVTLFTLASSETTRGQEIVGREKGRKTTASGRARVLDLAVGDT